MSASSGPIGIFDSGIGGLTVARAIKDLCPSYDIIYFGDTAHLPYGDKSPTAIQAYSIKICNLLLEKGCSAILIACNSASSAAYELVKTYVGSRAHVFNVIDPVVKFVAKKYSGKSVGVIGTRQTISSHVYNKKIDDLKSGIYLKPLATPLLAKMIEEGFVHKNISGIILKEYLSKPELSNIAALILGCTHYPLIKEDIAQFYDHEVDIVDSATVVAKDVIETLKCPDEANKSSYDQFFVSDYTESFHDSTRQFFGEKIDLQLYPIWD